MKLTESMVRDLVDTRLTAEEIGDLLTMVGFEIEEILVVEGEKVLDINIMANRGDGASSLGIAREILARDSNSAPTPLYVELAAGALRGDENTKDVQEFASVSIETPDCTRFSARVVQGIVNGDSPAWIQERLRKIGQRPISLLVDLTNYVMIETGQPMHAYDLDKLSAGKIIVRSAKDGETLKTLDGTDHELQLGQMMICDENGPIGVAGVMGGESTEVSGTTTRCLLESAHFDHQSVRKTRKALGLQTDASYRFERYVDPEGTVRAMNRFVELLGQACDAIVVPGVLDIYSAPLARPSLSIRTARCSSLLGMEVTADEIERYLKALGCKTTRNGEDFEVIPPTWRIDLVREDDLIEEVGRIHGYDRIPEALVIGSTPVGGAHGKDALVDKLRSQLLRCGVNQTISHSLRDTHPLDADTPRVLVRNPHSPEMAHLRNSNLPSLAEAAVRNGGKDVHLFEIGKVFSQDRESLQLAILSTGLLDPPTWEAVPGSKADFFSLKGVVEHALKAYGAALDPTSLARADARFHLTRTASLGDYGLFGQIHPEIARASDLPTETFIAEIDLDKLSGAAQTSVQSKAVYRNPAARRDIAIVVSQDVPYATIAATIAEACGDVLEKQWLFDVYSGPGIEPGSHSLAIALQFRKPGNFTDEEANQVRDEAVSALATLGAKLR